MDAPQISILQDDKTPPPSTPTSLKPTKFKVKLLVNKKRSASQALPDDDRGEDEEDELIDDDEEVPQPTDPQLTNPPPPPAAPPKRASRSKAAKTGTAPSRRKPKAQPAAETSQVDITWFEVSQPDRRGETVQGHPGQYGHCKRCKRQHREETGQDTNTKTSRQVNRMHSLPHFSANPVHVGS
jgi:hypothetical protein